ncbi:hypothetical protein KP509_38G055200 [Ceratopteris richardii]|nr:hypothetical protein KP509_38G055200 [Ceratopteris richardii]
MLGGRLNVGFTPGARHDTMPPLAIFRAKLKKCCEELESSLLCYFPIDDSQFMAMHKKFQKLHNICLDAGHSRREDTPSHADIPNWGAVKSRTPWNNEKSVIENEVAFWRGGQPTDDGIQWLIHKGFKVIVDMRAEESSDLLAKSAMISAVSSRKLKHIKLPVEVSSNPTKDQVIEFSKLLADPNCHPLYLHSQKGVGRTSSMVSRWREIGLLRHSSEGSALSDSSSSLDSHSRADKMALDPSEGKDHIPKRRVDLADKHVLDLSRQADTTTTHEAMFSSTPFNAQRPVTNYLSKQEMKKFLRERQMLPGTSHLKGSVKTPEVQVAATEEPHPLLSSTKEHEEIKVYDKQGILGDLKKHEDRNEQLSVQANGFTLADQKAEHMASHHNPSQKDPNQRTETRDSTLYHSHYDGKEADDDDVPIIGDMCALTTGIVRLQSRKKAEMYLVRTDGFSCTREKVKESTLAFTHPSTQQQMLMWKTAPKTVLLLKKLGSELIQEAQQVASFLHYKEGMNVIVEPDVHDLFAKIPGFGFIQTFYVEDASNLHERVDFVVCLGGDGVILHASNIFRNAVPPVVSFNLGSLGFLTAHPFDHFMQDLIAIIHGNTMVEGVYITLRMRLRCEIYRHGKPVSGKFFDVLNEVVVDRGSSPYICKIECYERDRLITKVQADGVIVATPTGSTAYSTAAGGSMVHPNVPCMLFTPICPHSLSFRPVILPDSAVLELKVPEDARSNVWVSFDGKRRQQLSRGDSVRISMSQHPLPTVNKSDQTDDWFQSLVRCLNWNERLEQKAFS